MRIGDTNDRKAGPRIANEAAERATVKAGGKSGKGEAGATDGGGVLVRLGDVAAAVSAASRRPNVPDTAKVTEILRRISSGEFQIDFERLADKMLDEETTKGRRGR